MIKYLFVLALIAWVCASPHVCTGRISRSRVQTLFPVGTRDTIVKNVIDQIRYVELGDTSKPVLVFIHGSPGGWEPFRIFAYRDILESYRVVFVDRPGYGYSSYGEPRDLREQVVLLSNFLKNTFPNNTDITLVGHSYGGPVVAGIAAMNIVPIRRIVIVSGALDPRSESPQWWRVPGTWPVVGRLVPGIYRVANTELYWLKSDLLWLERLLPRITVQTDVLHALDDELVPCQSNTEYILSQFTGVIPNISVLSSGGHMLPKSRHAVLKSIILAR